MENANQNKGKRSRSEIPILSDSNYRRQKRNRISLFAFIWRYTFFLFLPWLSSLGKGEGRVHVPRFPSHAPTTFLLGGRFSFPPWSHPLPPSSLPSWFLLSLPPLFLPEEERVPRQQPPTFQISMRKWLVYWNGRLDDGIGCHNSLPSSVPFPALVISYR